MTLTPDECRRLKDIEHRAEEAHEGPWTAEPEPKEIDRCAGITANDGVDDVVRTDCGIYPPDMKTAQFIAHAREDVPWLLELVRKLSTGGRHYGWMKGRL